MSQNDVGAGTDRKPVLGLCALSLLAVAAAYQVHLPAEIHMGSRFLSRPFVEGFHAAEGGYRWSRAKSCLTFPDVGAGIRGRLEIDVSGFRPRGQEEPTIYIEAEGASQHRRVPRRIHTVSIPLTTAGSDLECCILSETFSPGPGDRRALGVRVHRARWIPDRPFGLGLPSFRQAVLASLLVGLLFGTLIELGMPRRVALSAGLGAALLFGVGCVLVRPYVTVGALPLFLFSGGAYVGLRFFRSFLLQTGQLVVASSRAAWRGLRMVLGWRGLALAAAGVVCATAVHTARPRLVVDVGSGEETTLAKNFGSYDAASGVNFRLAERGAELDLRDFGGGGQWKVVVRAARRDGEPQPAVRVRAGEAELNVKLGPEWTEHTMTADVPLRWRSGLRIELPDASESTGILLDRVEVDRDGSWPSPRVVAAVIGLAMLFHILCGACGLEARGSMVGGCLVLAAEALAMVMDPVLVLPFTPALLGVGVLGLGIASLGGGALHLAKRGGWNFEQGPAVMLLVTVGFFIWLAGMAFPLYRGLHFVYHSSIAEQIWKGRFLVFYLPHPENILSREAQWGGLVVPYSCLYHVLMAPLSALPAAWFHFIQKVFQAWLLATTALVAALLARRFGTGRAAVGAALLVVSLPMTFQLLGLAHFLTVLGCWASTLALGFLTLWLERLDRRGVWWAAAALLTFAFLSYTAVQLFAPFALAMAWPFVYREDPRLARRLMSCTLLAAGAAFLLYYMHWVLPFVRESIPLLLSPSGRESFPLWARLAAIPRKLDYSFGSALIPILGLVGLAVGTVRSEDKSRHVLRAWAAILVVFSIFDLFFNFILKHHYFVITPVAVGGGLLLDWLDSRGLLGRIVRLALVASVLVLGGRAALALALGTMK